VWTRSCSSEGYNGNHNPAMKKLCLFWMRRLFCGKNTDENLTKEKKNSISLTLNLEKLREQVLSLCATFPLAALQIKVDPMTRNKSQNQKPNALCRECWLHAIWPYGRKNRISIWCCRRYLENADYHINADYHASQLCLTIFNLCAPKVEKLEMVLIDPDDSKHWSVSFLRPHHRIGPFRVPSALPKVQLCWTRFQYPETSNTRSWWPFSANHLRIKE